MTYDLNIQNSFSKMFSVRDLDPFAARILSFKKMIENTHIKPVEKVDRIHSYQS